jgi:DNA-binding transcriptional MerR regulator
VEGFSTPEAASITGVNAKTLSYWDTSGFLRPGIRRGRGTGSRRRYNFGDLLAIRAVRALRERGISLQRLRRVVAYLQKCRPDLENPVQGAFLLTDGTDVYIKDRDSLLSALMEPGQGLLFEVFHLSRAADEIRAEVLRLERETASRRPRGAAPAEAG